VQTYLPLQSEDRCWCCSKVTSEVAKDVEGVHHRSLEIASDVEGGRLRSSEVIREVARGPQEGRLRSSEVIREVARGPQEGHLTSLGSSERSPEVASKGTR